MHTPRRVLVIKLLALGDVVMASTMIGAIRRRWPEARITWVTGRQFEPLVARFDGVDEVVAIDESDLLTGSWVSRLPALVRAWRAIGRHGWDLALVAHADRRYKALLTWAGAREVRVARAGSLPRTPLPDVWMGYEYAQMVTESAPSDHGEVQLASLRTPVSARTRDVLLAPGGARNLLRNDHLRRWPLEHWVQLARQLSAAGEHVTLIGGDDDHHEGRRIAEAVPHVRNDIGRTSLSELVTRIATARLLITHDSGPLHLAALTRTPTVALFGPTNAAERLAPGAPVLVASAAAALPCAPCYDGRDYAPCPLNRCLTEVSVDALMALARRLLDDESLN